MKTVHILTVILTKCLCTYLIKRIFNIHLLVKFVIIIFIDQ